MAEENTLQAAIAEPAGTEAPGLEKVFLKYHERIFRTAYRITGAAEDAEDALQAVFLNLVRRGGAMGEVDNLEGYLGRAAVNAALDVLRSRRSARRVPIESVSPRSLEDPRMTPDRDYHSQELRTRLRQAISALNPKAAEIFALRYFEGYSLLEIARLLGSSRATVAVNLFRTRSRLQRELRAFSGGRV